MKKLILLGLTLLCATLLQAQRPLGTFIPGSMTTSVCPTGAVCQNFTITIPSANPIPGELAVFNPSGTINAVDVFFSWEAGTSWWGGMPNPSPTVASFFTSLLAQGHQIILVRWTSGAWYGTPQGTQLGQLAAACRPATVMDWLRQHYPSSSFNVIGTSAGSGAVAYALANYPVSMNIAVVDAGPPFMEIAAGCKNIAGYAYNAGAKNIVDLSYGFLANGPCSVGNLQYEDVWNTNSVEAGLTFLYLNTIVHVTIGTSDDILIQNRGTDFYNLLLSNGQNVQFHSILHGNHGAFSSTLGLDTLYSILSSGAPSATPTPGPTATAVPTATATATCTCPP